MDTWREINTWLREKRQDDESSNRTAWLRTELILQWKNKIQPIPSKCNGIVALPTSGLQFCSCLERCQPYRAVPTQCGCARGCSEALPGRRSPWLQTGLSPRCTGARRAAFPSQQPCTLPGSHKHRGSTARLGCPATHTSPTSGLEAASPLPQYMGTESCSNSVPLTH